MKICTIPLALLFCCLCTYAMGQAPPPPPGSPVGNIVTAYGFGDGFTYNAADEWATFSLSSSKLDEMQWVQMLYGPGYGVVWGGTTTTSTYSFPIHTVKKKCVGTIYQIPGGGGAGGEGEPIDPAS